MENAYKYCVCVLASCDKSCDSHPDTAWRDVWRMHTSTVCVLVSRDTSRDSHPVLLEEMHGEYIQVPCVNIM